MFVTYADVPADTLSWIEEQIRKEAYFEHIVFQQASAAISSNCGPGTFGILYFLKSNKSYNIASYINEMETVYDAEEDTEEYVDESESSDTPDVNAETYEDATDVSTKESKWYDEISCINAKAALESSGSEEAFKTVLKIFYDSIEQKHSELDDCYSKEDWENYTIKIHALKSSARLVGALELGENAQLLETAGKEKDVEYIRQHHPAVMEDYVKLGEDLAFLYNTENENDAAKPMADTALIVDMYEGLHMAAEAMDCDMLEDILNEIGQYRIPDNEKDKFDSIRQMADTLDYDGILRIIG